MKVLLYIALEEEQVSNVYHNDVNSGDNICLTL